MWPVLNTLNCKYSDEGLTPGRGRVKDFSFLPNQRWCRLHSACFAFVCAATDAATDSKIVQHATDPTVQLHKEKTVQLMVWKRTDNAQITHNSSRIIRKMILTTSRQRRKNVF